MKHVPVLLVALLALGCGSSDADSTAETVATDEDIDVCSCVFNMLASTSRARACTELMSSMSPEELGETSHACRKAREVPQGGPDKCYCAQALVTDPDIAAACREVLSDVETPQQVRALTLKCAKE